MQLQRTCQRISIWRQRPAGAKGWVIEVTPQEFDFIRASIKSAYPTFNVMPDQYSIRMWYRMLGDLDYKLCETALMELFATHTYPPQISEIREKCAEYTVPHLKDQGEAWGEVQKAISQYGYYRQEEALESLTPIVREAVKRLGFREICLDENQDAVRAHFFKIYSTLIERKTNDAKLPPSILEAKNKYIAQLTTHENAAIEQQHRDQIAEEPERATPEYIDMLMREHGFKR
nr:replicative helicase loader/inhibitor [Blautia massiliensis (ex Durand et al. 2017)]